MPTTLKKPGRATKMVRLKPETHKRLQKLAKESQRSLLDVLDEAISDYERQKFLEAANESFARLRQDPEAWQEYLAERKEWEVTLMDGLEDDPPYPMDGLPPLPEKSPFAE